MFAGEAGRLTLSIASAILLAFLSGCSPTQPPQVPFPLPPSPPSPSAEHLLASLENRRLTLVALRGVAKVEYQDAQERGSARQAVVVAWPDRFRLEIFSPMGIASLTTCDGKTLAAYFPRENTIYRGAATPLNLARFIRVILSVKEAVNLLLGFPQVHASIAETKVSFDGNRDRYKLERSLPNAGKQVLWFDRHTLLLARSEEIAPDGSLLFAVSFADYREINSLRFPFEIAFFNEQEKWRVALYYKRVELNPDLANSLFSLPSRPGVKEVAMDALPGDY